jgi:hypothetical protein
VVVVGETETAEETAKRVEAPLPPYPPYPPYAPFAPYPPYPSYPAPENTWESSPTCFLPAPVYAQSPPSWPGVSELPFGLNPPAQQPPSPEPSTTPPTEPPVTASAEGGGDVLGSILQVAGAVLPILLAFL